MEERRKNTCPLDEEHSLLMRVIFGDDELGEMGMKEKVDEIYDILTSAKNLIKVLDTFSLVLKWVAGIVIIFGLFKGWFAGLIAFILNK